MISILLCHGVKVCGRNLLRHTPRRARLLGNSGRKASDNCDYATGGKSMTTPDEILVVGDIPHVDASAVAAEARKPSESRDTKNPKTSTITIDPENLKVAALEDANRIREATLSIDLDKVGVKDARIIMSEEHKSLGYRPPPDSLAAKAQQSATKHPDSSLGLDAATLREAARTDAERIK